MNFYLVQYKKAETAVCNFKEYICEFPRLMCMILSD
jgi:hypothetical protein